MKKLEIIAHYFISTDRTENSDSPIRPVGSDRIATSIYRLMNFETLRLFKFDRIAFKRLLIEQQTDYPMTCSETEFD